MRPFVGSKHLDEEAHDAGRGVELAAVLALGAGELGEEVFEDAAEEVLRPAGDIGELDGADEIDEFAEAVFVEVGAAVVFVERAFEAGVVAFEGDHGVVHVLADARKLGVALEVGPAGFLRHPEDIGGEVFVLVLGIGSGEVALPGDELGVVFVEAVGDVFDSQPPARPSGHAGA
jgi:hypothetical protein